MVLLNGGNEIAADVIRIGYNGRAMKPSTLDEVKTVIRGLENNKAAGKNELPAELLKHVSTLNPYNIEDVARGRTGTAGTVVKGLDEPPILRISHVDAC